MSIKSFSEQAFNWGANSVYLNPDNEGQDSLNIYLGKPLRAVTRLIYSIAALTIIPTVGAFYHLGKSIQFAVASDGSTEARAKAWLHLCSSGLDALVSVCHITALILGPIALASLNISRNALANNALANNAYLTNLFARPYDLPLTTGFLSFFLSLVLISEVARTGAKVAGIGAKVAVTTGMVGASLGIASGLVAPTIFALCPNSFK